ncbi:hypothetical protein FC82_GL001611 [Secundilactobacillus collinoides DSM 20515 = JCM 1123]|uniref:Uncharacterized protein n=1 Tax=Secundilactobacillus collinoides DSM 20515 = JCM 1123 TaxID=1423733 RepID=A0A0R2BJV9_SECCO|nr:hypothetical protein FC82_GL001611 [Secundilactobacillus collinoides DSM 20515 = JCM 1123]
MYLLCEVAFSIAFLIKTIALPIWVKLSDQIGHKPMLLRASSGSALCCFLVSMG